MGTGFRGLTVSNKTMEMAVAIYDLTPSLPDAERFGLTSQMRRAAVSVASNIAEGHAKTSTGSYLLHLGHARGSSAELETQISIARSIGFCDVQSSGRAERLNMDVSRLLKALIKNLSPNKSLRP